MIAQNKSNEIKITRIDAAPLQAVWDAWTDPEQAANDAVGTAGSKAHGRGTGAA